MTTKTFTEEQVSEMLRLQHLGLTGNEPPPKDNPPPDNPPKQDPPADPPKDNTAELAAQLEALKAEQAAALEALRAEHAAELGKRDTAMDQLAQRLNTDPNKKTDPPKIPSMHSKVEDIEAYIKEKSKDTDVNSADRFFSWTNPDALALPVHLRGTSRQR